MMPMLINKNYSLYSIHVYVHFKCQTICDKLMQFYQVKNNLKENQIDMFYIRGKLNTVLLNVKEEIY